MGSKLENAISRCNFFALTLVGCNDKTQFTIHALHTYQTLFEKTPTHANVSKYCTLVHLRYAFLECIEDPIENEKLCTVGNGSI